MEQQERIKEIFSDETYVRELLAMESPEAVAASLQEKDIDLSAEDVTKIRDLLEKKVAGELSDEELEQVAGGLGLAGCAIIELVVLVVLADKIKNRRW